MRGVDVQMVSCDMQIRVAYTAILHVDYNVIVAARSPFEKYRLEIAIRVRTRHTKRVDIALSIEGR
jgi:hypothetical protein